MVKYGVSKTIFIEKIGILFFMLEFYAIVNKEIRIQKKKNSMHF